MRPSELYGIHDEFAAWCFDRAVTTFGQAVEEDIRKQTRKAKDDAAAGRKAKLVLNKWLTMPIPEGASNVETKSLQGRKFRDPAERFRKVSSGG